MLSQVAEAQARQVVWPPEPGQACGSACRWDVEDEAKRATLHTGLWGRVEAAVRRHLGKLQGVHS